MFNEIDEVIKILQEQGIIILDTNYDCDTIDGKMYRIEGQIQDGAELDLKEFIYPEYYPLNLSGVSFSILESETKFPFDVQFKVHITMMPDKDILNIYDDLMKISDLKRVICKYRKEEGFDYKDNVHNLIKAIAVESGELLELINFKNTEDVYNMREDLEHELADVLIYCFALAERYNISITRIVHDKIEYNQVRGRKY